MKRTVPIALASATLVAIFGCGGGGGSEGTKSGTFVGRVTSVVAWKVPDDIFARLTPESRNSLKERGITIDDTTKTMTSQELPLAGHWVRIGDKVAMTDGEGIFKVSGTIPKAGSAPVTSQMDSQTPEGQFPLASMVPEGQTPAPVRLQLSYALPPDMNIDSPANVTRAAGPDGCPMRDSCKPPLHPDGNKAPCCLDYDGNVGDGLPRRRGEGGLEGGNDPGPICTTQAYTNFINSTCYLWTFVRKGRPCSNEGAINEVGPTCWVNHRFRNCQNMDEFDFHVTPRVKVPLGGKVTFKVRNNTAANHSLLTWRENPVPGKLELEAGVPSSNAGLKPVGGGFELAHFSIDRKEHYEEVVLSYTAPESLPDGKYSAVYHLQASGGGQTEEVEIVVGEIEELELTPTSSTIKEGATIQLTAVARDTKGNSVSVPFSFTSVGGAASVNSSGLVRGNAEGVSVITVHTPAAPNLKATATVTVKKEEEKPKPVDGRHTIVSVNGSVPPVVVHQYYDEQLKYNWRMTIFSGTLDLSKDGTFAIARKGGEYAAPITLKGSGTYAVVGKKLKLTYKSGTGPGELAITGNGEFTHSYVFKKDDVHYKQDVPVTEIYKRQ